MKASNAARAKGLGQVVVATVQLKQEETVGITKPFSISKRLVLDAFNAVKSNAGSAGVDKISIENFETDLKDNLYKIWNRMLAARFVECGLEMHPDKTKIVYCKDGKRRGAYPATNFTFLGFTFRSRVVKNNKTGVLFESFTPAVSTEALKAMKGKTRKTRYRRKGNLSLQQIAHEYNPVLRGWLQYYGKFSPSSLDPVWRHFNRTLIKWAMSRYSAKLKGHKVRASLFIIGIAKRNPGLFIHWEKGMKSAFA